MGTIQDRCERLTVLVADLTAERKEIKADIAKQKRRLQAKSETVRTDAAEALKQLEAALAEVEVALARATSDLDLERAMRTAKAIFDAMKDREVAALEVGGAGSPESDRVVSARLSDLGNVRGMQNFLKGRAGEIVEALRPFVMAHFKGYTRSDDPERRYPAWFADACLFIAVLQHNPTYSLTVDQLIALVGLQQGTALLEVNYGAVERMVKEGLLMDAEGNAVTFERLEGLRKRKERTPLLELKPRGDQPIEELLELIDPRFAERGIGIEALALDTATENALRAAGYTMVEQVRASFDTLQRIVGIGAKRAERIINALVRRAA